MINFKINDVLVEIASQVTYNRNRKEKADFGSVTVLNNREARYEPYSRVEFTSDGITEQYLIESDEPLQQKDILWEHEITLIENMAILTTIFPVDRQFTRVPALTIRQVLDIYQNELRYYQGFIFDYDDTDTLLDTTIVNKEYTGQDFAAIIYDLFRRIDAIPRLTWNNGWVLSYELYTNKASALTVNPDNNQSSVNDIDYATEVITKTRNAVNEDGIGIWFPSKEGYVTPRSKGTKLTTSELQYELDSDISAIYEAIVKFEIIVQNTDVYSETHNIEVDISKFIVTEDIYKSLQDDYSMNFNDYKTEDYTNTPITNIKKQQCITYKLGNNVIETLFTKDKTWLLDSSNTNHIANALASSLFYEFGDAEKTALKAEIEADNPTIFFAPDGWSFLFAEPNERDVKLRIRYRPLRDITYISEKLNNKGFNKATIKNEQRDSSVEISRMLQNSSVIVNRIGNKVINISEQVDSLSLAWQLGDYINEEWLATDIQYQLDKNHVVVTADFTKNFSNIDRETSITREPSAYVYTGKNITSNYILREYLVLYKDSTEQVNDSELSTTYKSIIMNIFDYNTIYNSPLRHMLLQPLPFNDDVDDDEAIHMPIMSSAGGNTIIMHSAFRDARIAGNGLQKIGAAWYKKPIYYTDENFFLKNAEVKISNSVDYKTDTSIEKYYPLVNRNELVRDLRYVIPVDKDPNDIFALTWQLIIVSEDDDIVVPNGFAKFNNLIKEYDTAPDITIYESAEKYTIFDKLVKGTETSGSITLTSTYIEVLDSLDAAIENWALVIDGEIILAANDSTSRVNYLFTSRRRDTIIVSDYTIAPEIELNVNVEENISVFEYITIAPELSLSVTVNEDLSRLYYVYNTVQPTLELDVNVTEQTVQVKYIYNTVQPTLNLNIDVTEQSLQQEQIVNTVQPEITLDINVTEQSVIQEVIEVTMQPTITLETSVVEQSLQQVNIVNTVQPELNLSVNYIQNIMTNLKAWSFISSQSIEYNTSEYDYNVGVAADPATSPGVDVNNYEIGDIIMCNDGQVSPTTYYLYEVVYKY